LLQWLARQGIDVERQQGGDSVALLTIVDGTGIGYATAEYQRCHRGAEVRGIRSHVKVVGLVYWGGGRRWVVGLRLVEAYSDEGRLLSEWLGEHGAGVVGAGALRR